MWMAIFVLKLRVICCLRASSAMECSHSGITFEWGLPAVVLLTTTAHILFLNFIGQDPVRSQILIRFLVTFMRGLGGSSGCSWLLPYVRSRHDRWLNFLMTNIWHLNAWRWELRQRRLFWFTDFRLHMRPISSIARLYWIKPHFVIIRTDLACLRWKVLVLIHRIVVDVWLDLSIHSSMNSVEHHFRVDVECLRLNLLRFFIEICQCIIAVRGQADTSTTHRPSPLPWTWLCIAWILRLSSNSTGQIFIINLFWVLMVYISSARYDWIPS